MFYKIYDWLWNFNDSALTPEEEIFLRKNKRKTIILVASMNLAYIVCVVFILIQCD